jgi:Asp-tRNA(Asn)/Glu-tRNA(Gln) amidotransferase A subunit family amidase
LAAISSGSLDYEAGLPLSLQIVGHCFDETTALRIGNAYERATPWRAPPPASVTVIQPSP